MSTRGDLKWKLVVACLLLMQAPALLAAHSSSGSRLSAVSVPVTAGNTAEGRLNSVSAAPPEISTPPAPPEISTSPAPLDDVSGTPDVPVRSLRSVIRMLEQETGFRFLYRDVIVTGVDIRFDYGANWREDFRYQLHEAGLDLLLNEERRQIVLFSVGSVEPAGLKTLFTDLQGYVIDEKTGERLPFATVIRVAPDQQDRAASGSAVRAGNASDTEVAGSGPDVVMARLQGVQTDINGRFRLTVPAGEDLHLRVSYVGYHARTVAIEADELPVIGELPVRLEPAAVEGREIVLHAPVLHQSAGTNDAGSLLLDGFSPLGESSAVRMLQTLPSVGTGTALSDGAFIRGSNSDALQILLDGSVIYNHSHLFGLVDSFNADAIRTSSFHYDVTPARYQGPPGGTLSLITRSGSLYRYRGSAGISSSALNGSLEGPLQAGRSSLFVSGRTSMLNGYGFPGTEDLVAWGLNVGRPNSLDDDVTTLEDRIVTPGSFEVTFHDLHGKFFLEDNRGNRWMLSGYSGFNNTRQEALRLVRPRPVRHDAPLVREEFETRNRWGNNSANLAWFRPLEGDMSLHFRTGMSYYHTRYLKEDFSYQRPGRNLNDQLLFIHPFENESELTHWYVEADLIAYRPFGRRPGGVSSNRDSDDSGNHRTEETVTVSNPVNSNPANSNPANPEPVNPDPANPDPANSNPVNFLSFLKNLRSGLALHGYRSAYLEESLNRSRYFQRSTPLLLEGYVDSEWVSGGVRTGIPLDAQAGARLQYFSDGGYVRLSPRFSANLFPKARISPSFGYSRSYQYLYKLSFYNQTTSDIWITASENQKPAAVDMWSAAVRVRVAGGWFLHSEWYYKHQRNLRFHEINIQNVQTPLEGAPWFADNAGYARGWELQAGFAGKWLSLTQSYTLSRTELSNLRLNQGERFPAYWDRTHQFNTLISLHLLPGLSVDGNWFLASGVPDRLDLFRSGNTRLGTYSRIDLSVRYDIASGPHRWALQVSVYNLTNRQNPWYRDWVQTIRDDRQFRRLEPVQVDFYDLGFQPSLSLRYYLDP